MDASLLGIDRIALVTAMSAGLAIASPALAEERACHIDQLTGEAAIRNATGERAARTGAELGAADTLITGENARVGIACSDDIVLTVGPETELELGALVGEAGERRDVLMNLDRGIARFLAPIRTWRIFSVGAPGGVASVRSTEWVILVEDGTTAILTLEGSVAVKARAVGGAVLPAGSGIDIDAEGRMRKVGKWGAARVAKVKAVLGLE